MYAVVEQGGKQYKVAEGDSIQIELADVAPDADKIELDKVLLVNDGKDIRIGTPYVEGARVTASFAGTAADAVVKGQKLHPTYKRRRKNSQKRTGHRQKYLQATVDKIEA